MPSKNRIHELFQQAVQLSDAGDITRSKAAFEQLLQIEPNHVDALHRLGLLDCRAGRFDAGVERISRAVSLSPNFSEALYNLGVAQTDRGDIGGAIDAYRRAIAVKPDFAQAHYNLAVALSNDGNLREAIELLKIAISLHPHYPEAHCNLGVALEKQGNLDAAIAAYRAAILLNPNWSVAHFNLGLALSKKGAVEEAITAYRKAISLNPSFAQAHYNLAELLKAQGDFKAAAKSYLKAIECRPDDIDALYNLGSLMNEQGRLDEATDAYRRVVALQPAYSQAWNNLAIALKNSGRVSEAIEVYRKAIAIKPEFADAHSNLLMTLHYAAESTSQSLRAEHYRWNVQHAQPLCDLARPHANDATRNRTLRIGYVSGDFWDHAAARFILPLLSNHDRSRFHVFCYSNSPKIDRVTERLQEHCDGWRKIAGVSDDHAAQIIRDDRIDILVDLSMHTQGNLLLVFARKPAPVQVTWLGYAGTTGMSAVDWRVTDSQLDPLDSPANEYCERSIRLPKCFWCYDPIHPTPEVGPLRAVETGQITFGCFNNFAKVSVAAQELWARIMAELPESQLILHCHQGSHRKELLDRFASHGIDQGRIEFVGRLPLLEYMRRYRQTDIALDPFPFTGGTTTCDALWMGVPVVTLRGGTAVGRGGASILCNAGLSDWVADTPEQYIQIAVDRARDLPELALLRSELRERFRQSPLMNGAGFAADMESLYQIMWRDWCGRNGSDNP